MLTKCVHWFVLQALIGDKGYNADGFVAGLEVRHILPVIPPKANRKAKRTCDVALHAERNPVDGTPKQMPVLHKSYVDDLRMQGFSKPFWWYGQVQSYVRPTDAVHMTAGPDGVRGSGPYQDYALRCALNFSGLPDPRLDRSPSRPLHPRI